MFRLLKKITLVFIFLLIFIPSSQAMVEDQGSLVVKRANRKLQKCVQKAECNSFKIAKRIIELIELKEESRLVHSCVTSPFCHGYCSSQDGGYVFLVLQYFFLREYEVDEVLKPDFVLPKIKVQISAKKFSKEFLNQKGIQVELDFFSEVFLVTNAEEFL